MKKIEAYIKSHRLDSVTAALRQVQGLTGLTVIQAHGFGRGHQGTEVHPTVEMVHDLNAVVRLEIFCRDELVQEITTVIQAKSHTGLRGDGKIYVLPVEQAIRISSSEEGPLAV
ncbi:MAG: P-II family nitrogen regulator [Phycisphaeraceae bacterium]|nr:P-II family nitrogen regulator [Phycisphaeraceae bacterium]